MAWVLEEFFFYFLRILHSAYSVVCHTQYALLWTFTVLVFVKNFCFLIRLHLCWKWLDNWCDWQYLKLVEIFAFLFRMLKIIFGPFTWQFPITSLRSPPDSTMALCWCETGPGSTVQLCILPCQEYFQQVLLLNTSIWLSSVFPFCGRASLDDVFWEKHRAICTRVREWQGMAVAFLLLYHSPLKLLQHPSEIGVSSGWKWLPGSCELVLSAYLELGPAE